MGISIGAQVEKSRGSENFSGQGGGDFLEGEGGGLAEGREGRMRS